MNLLLPDNTTIALRDFGGTGLPLILLHGGGRNLCDWTPLVPYLTPHHHVYAMEFRSHGQSTPNDTRWTFSDALADLEAMIAYLELDNPIVAGHSLGGITALLYGAGHPAARGVINIDGVGISIPARFPVPDPASARESLLSLMSALAPIQPTESLPFPDLLTRDQLDSKLASIRAEAQAKGEDPTPTVERAERSYFPRSDGLYEPNPSERAIQALSLEIMGIDIFNILPTVRCPLLFIAADEPRDPQSEIDPDDVMLLWRAGLEMEFQHLTAQHKNISYAAMPGDHLSILETPIPMAHHILSFTSGLK